MTTLYKSIPLQLSTPQVEKLKELNDDFLVKIEKEGQVTYEIFDALKKEMTHVVNQHQDLQSAIEDSDVRKKTQIIQLTDRNNELLNLPWRVTMDGIQSLYLTKGLESDGNLPTYHAKIPMPLKILVMIASPENSDWKNRLSFEAEETQLREAFEPLFEKGLVQIDYTIDGSLEELGKKLKANHYHILHFSGHGVFREGQGFLALENPITQRQELIPAADFADCLNKKPEHIPPLVLLSSCQTAQGTTEKGLHGVTNQLLQIGVPAVIAMGLSIKDFYATRFAAHFYHQLAEHEPIHRAFKTAVNYIRQLESEVNLKQLKASIQPTQWLIPQLYLSHQIENVIDWSAANTALKFNSYKFFFGGNRLILEKKEGYQFIGRRTDLKRILPVLIKKEPILLQGQGGVGKTSMAEYLVQRLVDNNSKVYPFVFDEKTRSSNDIIVALQTYLQKEKRDYNIVSEVNQYEKAQDKFTFLLKKVDEVCEPVFIFDNLETFQSAPGEPFAQNFSDLAEIIQFLFQMKHFHLLLTCRFPVTECPDIQLFDLNQVHLNDFYQKCNQLKISELRQKIFEKEVADRLNQKFDQKEKVTYRQIIELLHKTFGGNYRAVEFFDKIFEERFDKSVDALKVLKTFEEKYDADKEKVLQEVSKDLAFKELVKLLDEEEKQVLQLLSGYRIPVLTKALELQNDAFKYEPILKRLQELTLVERQEDLMVEMTFFYATPIVKDLLESMEMKSVEFSSEQAGRYHYYMVMNLKLKNLMEMIEVYFHSFNAKNEVRVNEAGWILTDHFYGVRLFKKSYFYGSSTFNLLKENTYWRIHNRLGLICHLWGRYDESDEYLNTALNIVLSLKEEKGEAIILNNLALNFSSRKNIEIAEKYFNQSLKIYEKINNKEGKATILNSLAAIAIGKGNEDLALKYLNLSLSLSEEIGDREGEADALRNISSLSFYKKNFELSTELGNKSLMIYREIGNIHGQGLSLGQLATVALKTGNSNLAIEYYEESLRILEGIDQAEVGILLYNISHLYKIKKQYEIAFSYLKKSIEIQKEIGNKENEIKFLRQLAIIAIEIGQSKFAKESLEKSISFYKENNDKKGVALTLNEFGVIALSKNKFTLANKYFNQSKIIMKEIGDKKGEASVLRNLANIAKDENDLKLALKYLKESLLILKIIDDKQGISSILCNMAFIAKQNKQNKKYLTYINQAYNLAVESQEIRNIFDIGSEFGFALCSNGNIKKGLPLLHRSLKIGKDAGYPAIYYIEQLIQKFS